MRTHKISTCQRGKRTKEKNLKRSAHLATGTALQLAPTPLKWFIQNQLLWEMKISGGWSLRRMPACPRVLQVHLVGLESTALQKRLAHAAAYWVVGWKRCMFFLLFS